MPSDKAHAIYRLSRFMSRETLYDHRRVREISEGAGMPGPKAAMNKNQSTPFEIQYPVSQEDPKREDDSNSRSGTALAGPKVLGRCF